MVFLNEDKDYLEKWLSELVLDSLHKNNCDFIGLVGLLFFSIYKLRLDLFRKALGIFYRVVKNNEGFLRFGQNFVMVILRMIEEKVPLQSRLLLLQNTWPIFFGLVGWGLKHYFNETWTLEEIKDREKALKIQGLFTRRVEVLSKYFNNDSLSKIEIPDCYISTEALTRKQILEEGLKDLLNYLSAFIRNEREKPDLFRWMKSAGALINENKKFFQKELFTLKVNLEEDVNSVKRLNRGLDKSELIILRLFSSLVVQFQTLDVTEVPNYLGLMKCIKPIFEIIPEDTANGIVSKNNGLEETFLGYCDI